MDQPEHSSSDPVAPPRSLTERLKAEANGHAPPAPDLSSLMTPGHGHGGEHMTPSFMARRFAPDGLPLPDKRRVEVKAPLAPMLEAQAESGWGISALIAALILVALVPTATLGAMLWLGMIATPWTGAHDGASSAIEQASVTATLGPATTLSKKAVEVPAVALTAPDRLEAQAGQEVAFTVTLDGTDALPARSIIALSGLPVGSSLSDGRPYGATEWTLRPDEIGDLKLLLPASAAGVTTLKVQLVAPDGRLITSAETALKIAPDPRAALVQRPEETTLVADLIAHGNKMVGVGYFPGARAYFQRAAEAGSPEAALLLGETYDPAFIAKMGAQGIKPEPEQAIAWYERARALGAPGAEDKLAELKVAAKAAAPDSDPPAVAAMAADARAAMGGTGAGANDGAAATDGVAPELVELTGTVNVRESPSSNAATVRAMEAGTKLRAISRKGGWVQVTNPLTAETGWVYSRYVASVTAAAGQ